MEIKKSLLKFKGHLYFRQRLVLSLLSGKPIRITEIRPDDENPGLTDYEVAFLKLLEQLSNGTTVSISHTGTSFSFFPGIIINGVVNEIMPTSRALSYYLEPLLVLGLFGKTPLACTLHGVTVNPYDVQIDTLRTVCLPFLTQFGVNPTTVSLKVEKRGAAPLGGGEVQLILQPLPQVTLTSIPPHQGRIQRIRGLASSTRVSSDYVIRLMNQARSILTPFIPDVYIYTDVAKGVQSGLSPGYALSLFSESTTGVHYSSEIASNDKGGDPEEMASQCAFALLHSIELGGTVDDVNKWTALVLSVLAPPVLSKWYLPKSEPEGLTSST
ncbi:hypothetical protein HMI54_004404, partial [Coelomomyces lativittatus]